MSSPRWRVPFPRRQGLILQHTEKLERFNKLAVGREMRMVELKREINALLAGLGRGEKYTIHEPQRPE